MQHISCLICHEHVRVPVRLICFPCQKNPSGQFKKDYLACNDVARVCLSCAWEYLQLHEAPKKRDVGRKCLLCPAICALRELDHFSKAYERDHLYMMMDHRNDYPCLYDDRGCEFRGSHRELDRHQKQDCEFAKTLCNHCHESVQCKHLKLHLQMCSEKRIACMYCINTIRRRDIHAHTLNHMRLKMRIIADLQHKLRLANQDLLRMSETFPKSLQLPPVSFFSWLTTSIVSIFQYRFRS